MRKIKRLIILFLLFLIFCSLSLYRHKNIEPNTFRTEIWADRAGYYIYLPSLFLYSFSSDEFPENIEEHTGHGFHVNLIKNKVETKYTYGVALLQLPFFLVADFISSISANIPRDGFSFYYQKSINFAAVFYLIIGLYQLFLTLKIYFNYNNKTIFITLLALFFGTNLYYYGIVETGMSHIYSFFLFSGALYLVTQKSKFKNKYIFYIILAFTSWLIILIRPTNMIFVIIAFFWDAISVKQILIRIKENINPKILSIWVLSGFIIFIPQFIYWKYSTGSYLTYTYTNEGFTNALSPKFLEIFFSPNNGLFPYSLIIILALSGIILSLKNRTTIGLYSSIVFILVSYLTASWHDWKFGCGSGMRNMVENYSLLSFPLCYSIHKINLMNKKLIKLAFFTSIFLLVMISFKVNYHYYGCYFVDVWDWSEYIKTLIYPMNY